MISLCSVILSGMEDLLEIFFETINDLKLVKEVVLTKIDSDDNEIKTWKSNGINFKQININVSAEYGHSLGLHECIDNSQQPYLLFSDPDVFFYTAVDEFFFDLMQKHNLDWIGCSQHASVTQAHLFFPNFLSTLVKKSNMPDESFLKGKLKYRHGVLKAENLKPDDDGSPADGKYLVPSPIPELYQEFPNPEGQFDLGCNMWLWSKQQNWKWLGFQTTDCHLYTSSYNRGNIKLDEKLPRKKLLYHCVNGTKNTSNEFESFKEVYEDFKEDD